MSEGVQMPVVREPAIMTPATDSQGYPAHAMAQAKTYDDYEIARRSAGAMGIDKTSSGREFSKEWMNIVCPRHGDEFDIQTGVHAANRRRSDGTPAGRMTASCRT